ncbi:hypothetical protein OVA24_09270 [Luteolibacter sp. SL250]|uniref:hypothetical protein n=1 Tax=Luteolibacter sp. SL250 TaxID=2995170 RepID=UPI0022713976|nr:hypothetical protein [Luteolibacter sp. SL250]WAC21573.1 hypothetical protein OVA24_09270 [Luteolibacter sp. SL250]
MRLFRLTLTTILLRKAWVICALCVLVIPFVLPWISSASEKPVLIQPARIQAAWSTLWIVTMLWGYFTAAKQGETNATSGTGEYFLTTGLGATRQLSEIWLAVFIFILPMALATAAITQFAASPSDPAERTMWWTLNTQYLVLFLLVTAPLLCLAAALASRFGSVAGYVTTLALTLYGLYGVGYLDNLLKLEQNPILQGIWLFSPHYHFADLTQRLYFKSGALPTTAFWKMTVYFLGILALWSGISRLAFRTKLSS